MSPNGVCSRASRCHSALRVFVEAAAIVEARETVHVHQPLQLEVSLHQLPLADMQRAIGLVALQLIQVRAAVISDARDQFYAVREASRCSRLPPLQKRRPSSSVLRVRIGR